MNPASVIWMRVWVNARENTSSALPSTSESRTMSGAPPDTWPRMQERSIVTAPATVRYPSIRTSDSVVPVGTVIGPV